MISEQTLPQDERHPIQDLALESESTGTENVEEISIRPRFLAELIGREREKEVLNLLMSPVKAGNQKHVDHILFYGPPGLGKTTFANIVANELGVNMKITSGPAIERQGDIVALLTNLAEGDVLFIDEIHRMRKNIEEVLYPAMEDFKVDIMMGQGPGAQSVRLSLPRFTLVGATTRIGMLSSPLRDRFGAHIHLDFFSNDELISLLRRILKNEQIDVEADALLEIAKRSRGTARIAIRLLRRVKEYMLANAHNNVVTLKMAQKTLSLLGIDSLGLDDLDRKILQSIFAKFEGGPVGIKTLAAALSEDEETIEDVYEPYLMRAGLLKRTPRGRIITEHAVRHLEITEV
ncbi:MAG: Holliday junction branch migration DNA helicase RuvB [Candidatus Dojkabacteria bacterium]|nr:MAG: Holliday junction branch migration DNA helicase RuvB [Candidatus Dojkabacteria bacterium]